MPAPTPSPTLVRTGSYNPNRLVRGSLLLLGTCRPPRNNELDHRISNDYEQHSRKARRCRRTIEAVQARTTAIIDLVTDDNSGLAVAYNYIQGTAPPHITVLSLL